MAASRKYKRMVKDYADEFGVSVKTIAAWQEVEAPLDDADLMAKWFIGRTKNSRPVKLWLKNFANAKTKEAAKARRKAAKGKEEDATLPPQNVRLRNLVSGAAAALGRAEDEELDSYLAYKKLQDQGADISEQNAAHALWQKNAAQLRQYDIAVAQDQRDSGQLIPKEEITHYLLNVGYFIRAASRMSAKILAADLYQRPRSEICTYVTEMLWSTFQSSVAALPGDSPGNQVPEWVTDALLKDLTHSCEGVPENQKIRQEVMARLHWLLDQGMDLNEALKEDGAYTPAEFIPPGEPEYQI